MTKSNVISGMGVALSLVQTLVASVKKAGGTDDDIHRLTTPEADGVWKKIAAIIVEASKKIAQVFTVMVDYDRTVENSIAAGNYCYVNEDITDRNFQPAEHEKSKKKQSFTLYHFDRDVESDFAIVQMAKDGKRPATLRELLAFGEANPELQREFPIIALGSVWVDRHGHRIVASLRRCHSERCLHLAQHDFGWYSFCRFLAVSK